LPVAPPVPAGKEEKAKPVPARRKL